MTGFDKEFKTETGKRITISFNAVAVHYGWDCDHVAGLTIHSRDIPQANPEAIGAGPHKVFTIVANEPGEYQVHFKLAPLWGGEAAQTKSYKITAVAPK